MNLKNDLLVISLTHWDREWRFPFVKTRKLLVQMMDELISTLENNESYRAFHLDGHTILLDDYCEVRPENASRIKKLVEHGKLFIGPWYVLPEENQVSGESLIRNFLLGEITGRKYGGNMKVGYSPTSWGQISQMPQIMKGCGIDSIIFYRGISPEKASGNYYVWEGPDGSRIFGVRLGDYARSSFFHLVIRPVCFNRGRRDQEHDWAVGGKPFRICGAGSSTPYRFHEPPFGYYPERIPDAFRELEEVDLGSWETPFAPAFECNDSTSPFEMTPKIIEEANNLAENGKTVTHSTIPEFISKAMKYLENRHIEVIHGEMREPQRAGVWTDLYAEVQAERMPTKYANRRTEFLLQRTAEPLAAAAWTLGAPYPDFHLDRAYRLLVQNHAHDSIGGCGRDEINDEVLFRFRQADTLSRTVIEDAAGRIAGRIDTSSYSSEDMLLIVMNSLPRKRSGTVEAEIDIAKDRNIKGFTVIDPGSGETEVQIRRKRDFLAVFNHPKELPLRKPSDRWEFLFKAEDVPPMGYKVFRIKTSEGEYRHPGSLRTGAVSMENEFLRVTVNSNGTADIVSTESGAEYRGLNYFEDRGEVGDYWIGAFPLKDRIVNSIGSSAELAVIEDGPLSCSIQAQLGMNLPVRAAPDSTERVKETRKITITTVYTLVKGERFLRIAATIENSVEDHILRTVFPTNIQTDTVHAQVPFDVVERPIPLPDTRDWREPFKPVQPHRSFVDLTDGTEGFGLLNKGLPQYEAVDTPERPLALTLIRANRAWNSVRLAHYPDQNGTQLQGTYTFEYAAVPHRGDWQDGELPFLAEMFNVEPVVCAAGPGKGDLGQAYSCIGLEGDGLEMNCFKLGQWDRDSLIVRISNPTKTPVTGALVCGFHVEKAETVNLIETETLEELDTEGNRRIPVSVPAGKILTVLIGFSAAKNGKKTG